MTEDTQDMDTSVSDFSLPQGCLSCQGDLDLRMSFSGAFGFCPVCKAISKPQVDFTGQGIKVTYVTAKA